MSHGWKSSEENHERAAPRRQSGDWHSQERQRTSAEAREQRKANQGGDRADVVASWGAASSAPTSAKATEPAGRRRYENRGVQLGVAFHGNQGAQARLPMLPRYTENFWARGKRRPTLKAL